jgi:hypothetical protein
MTHHTLHELHPLHVNLYSIVVQHEDNTLLCYAMKGNLETCVGSELC